MNKFFISVTAKEEKHAGSKAVMDCEKILSDLGYKNICIKPKNTNCKIVNKILSLLGYFKTFKIKKNSVVVLQHPLYIGFKYMWFVCMAKKIKKFKLILMIHDIESLRNIFTKQNKKYKQLDDMAFNISDFIIAHNDSMKKYVINERGVNESKIFVLELFDYLCDKINKENTTEKSIVIAGNLDPIKAGYTYKIGNVLKNYFIKAYGVNCDADNLKGIYMGAFMPDEIPNVINGKYGLVWDNDELERCSGTVGEYLKYNNPHKVSLYIAAQLPIIIWKEAALADFVVSNKIGIAIDSLKNVEEEVENISEENYLEFKKNLLKLSDKVRNGYFLRCVLDKINGADYYGK